MKGHLGFRCQPCLPPSAPRNLRQVGLGYQTINGLRATIAWDQPLNFGRGFVGYILEYAVPGGWQPTEQMHADGGAKEVSVCYNRTYRVRALNACGSSPPSNELNAWNIDWGGSWVTLVTAQETGDSAISKIIPCWATSFTAYCVGCGGTSGEGGAGGGLAIRTFSRSDEQWALMTCVVRNAASSSGPALSSLTYGGQTVIAYGGSATNVGTATGGTSNYMGNPGGNGYQAYSGQPYASITYPFSGAVQYSGNYSFGGGIGGPTGNNPDGTAIRPLPVSPCRRHPAADQGNLLATAALAGQRVIEECVTEPAFGSGGVAFTIPGYSGSSGNVRFAPGYGGGGFDSTTPGGPGCILLKYT